MENRQEAVPKVNELLMQFGEIVIGRLGIPYRDRGVSVISVIVDGTSDAVGARPGTNPSSLSGASAACKPVSGLRLRNRSLPDWP